MTQENTATKSDGLISALLRVDAILQLGALVAVFMPFAWIQYFHTSLGLGEFPDQPIAQYLARSLSAFYALHGVITLTLSGDVPRYRPLIRVWASTFVGLGVVTILIGISASLPWFWTLSQGPFVIAFGLVILVLLRRSAREVV